MAYAMILAKWSCLRKLHHTVNIILMWTKLENVLIIFNLMIIFKWHEHGFVLGMKFKNEKKNNKNIRPWWSIAFIQRSSLFLRFAKCETHAWKTLLQRRIWRFFFSKCVYNILPFKNVCLPAFYSSLTLNWRQF